MINAGRILIIPKGDWSNIEPYEMLDLVTDDKTAYIARKASVGVRPQTDVQQEYWQPFGTAVEIATTGKPGIVMPDGTTISITQNGVISASISLDNLTNVQIVSADNGQVLAYSSILGAWQNKALGTASSRNATSSATSGSTDLIESGAVYTLNQTLTQQLANKVNTSDIANNLTTTTEGKVLDARQGKALSDSISDTNTAVSNKHKVTSIQVDTSNWSSDTTSQSGTTLYKKRISVSHVYVDSPSVDIGAASGSVLPTAAQQTAFDLLQYVTVDGTTMYLYGSDIPTDTYYINVEGVD